MFHRLRLKRPRRGQGLVEYALILSLIAVVVIVVMALVGQQVQYLFCDVLLYTFGDSAPEIEACEAPRVLCMGVGDNASVPSPINMEAQVRDNNGPESIARVEWYIDGNNVQTEHNYRYCLGGDDGSCNDEAISSGRHTIRAVAYDEDGNTGECSVNITITN